MPFWLVGSGAVFEFFQLQVPHASPVILVLASNASFSGQHSVHHPIYHKFWTIVNISTLENGEAQTVRLKISLKLTVIWKGHENMRKKEKNTQTTQILQKTCENAKIEVFLCSASEWAQMTTDHLKIPNECPCLFWRQWHHWMLTATETLHKQG